MNNHFAQSAHPNELPLAVRFKNYWSIHALELETPDLVEQLNIWQNETYFGIALLDEGIFIIFIDGSAFLKIQRSEPIVQTDKENIGLVIDQLQQQCPQIWAHLSNKLGRTKK